MIRAICFDVHDTLINKGGAQGLAAAKKMAVELLAKKYKHVNNDVFEQAWAKSMIKAIDLHQSEQEISAEEWYSNIYLNMGIFNVDKDLIYELNRAFMDGFRSYTTVFPGVRESLDFLSRSGYKLAVVSNSLGPNTRIDLETTGLVNYFEQIVISSEVGWRKPHPEIFRRVLELLDVQPSETVFVGDNIREDIKGATDAGIHAVMVSYTKEQNPNISAATKGGSEQLDFDVLMLDNLSDLGDIVYQITDMN